jgi:hypothetical protein
VENPVGTAVALQAIHFVCINCRPVMMDVCCSYTIQPYLVHYKQNKETENAGERDSIGLSNIFFSLALQP